jgi:iron complex outermembrane receptor protein
MKPLYYTYFFLLIGTAVFADDAPPPEKTTTVVVHGKRETKEPASSETVNIDESTKELYSLSDILSDRVGVQIKRYGGTGSYSTVSIRGSSATQVAVFLDGIPLSDSVYGEVNLDAIPIDAIDRIEIFRGSAPVRFGNGNIGGVINLISKKTKEEPEAKIAAGYGSFNTSKCSTYYTSGIGMGSFLVSGYRHSSDGNFSYRYDNGTNVNTDDDITPKRKNNDYTTYGSTLKADYVSGAGEFYILNDFNLKNQGVPDTYNTAEHTSFRTLKNMTSLGTIIRSPFNIPWTLDVGCFLTTRDTLYENPYDETGSGIKRIDGLHHSYGIKNTNTFEISRIAQKITACLSAREETYHGHNTLFAGDPYSYDQKRRMFEYGVEDEMNLFNGKLILRGSVSGTRCSDNFFNTNNFSKTYGDIDKKEQERGWNSGIVIRPLTDYIYFKSTVSRRYRIPTFGELFGDRGFIEANPDLKSETSLNRDFAAGIDPVSIGKFISNISLEYVYFISDSDRSIYFLQNTQRTLKAFNLSGARTNGHEISFASTVFSHIDLKWNFTAMKSVDKSGIPYYEGNYLPNRPGYESSFIAKIYNKYASVAYEHNYTGANYRDRANTEPSFIQSRIYHNILFQVFPFSGLTCSFEIRNITSNQTRDINGYPLPGRSCLGSISYIF